MDIIARTQTDFERMLTRDIPGQNWDCDIIADIGSGHPGTGHSISTRCVCYSKDGRQDQPTIRTSLTDPIQRGDMIYLPECDGGMFFLLEAVPQMGPNCYSSKGTRCNALITIRETVPASTDQYGYTVTEAYDREALHNIPAVVRHTQTVSSGTGAAGMFFADELTVTMQLNAFSSVVPVEAWFVLDGTRYIISDITTDGATHGTITYTAQRQAGSRTGG